MMTAKLPPSSSSSLKSDPSWSMEDGGPLLSISVHVLLQIDLLIILRVWAKAEEGVGKPSIQTAFKACRSPKLTTIFRMAPTWEHFVIRVYS